MGGTIWTKTYGGTNGDFGYSVQQSSDSGYIFAGGTWSYGVGSADIWLVKTNTLGDTVWTKTIGGSGYEDSRSVQQTNDGGYIVAGWTLSYGAGLTDIWLIKTNADGDTAWTRIYGGSNYEFAWSVQQTTDSGYIIAGQTSSYGAGVSDVWLIKTNATGGILWSKTFGGGNDEIGFSVQQTTDGGYIVVGETWSYGVGGDVWMIKTNTLGDTVWTKTHGGNAWDRGYSVQQTTDGGYIIAGHTQSYGAVSQDVLLIKTDSNGNQVWTKTIGRDSADVAYEVRQTTDGGYIIGGYTKSFGAGREDFWLIKMKPEGKILETNTSHLIPLVILKNNPCLGKVVFNITASANILNSGASNVSLKIMDVAGHLVQSFTVPIAYCSKPTAITWNGSDLIGNRVPTGIYFYTFEYTGHREKGKFILLR